MKKIFHKFTGIVLSTTEEFLIRAGGGPKTKENPYAVLQNKIYASSDEKYEALGGDFI